MANVQFPTLVAQKVQNIWNRDQGIVDEGTYFVATNPTPGTGIATTTSITTEDQTKPILLIQNQWTPGDPNAKNIYPLSLSMLVTAAPTSAAFWQYSIRLDAANPSKYTSGGSTIVPVNVNGLVNTGTQAKVYYGAVVALTQGSAGRLVAGGMMSPTIPLVKDTMRIEFGTQDVGPSVNTTAVNTTRTVIAPPICIPPGGWLALQMWGTSNGGAPAWEFQFDYVER